MKKERKSITNNHINLGRDELTTKDLAEEIADAERLGAVDHLDVLVAAALELLDVRRNGLERVLAARNNDVRDAGATEHLERVVDERRGTRCEGEHHRRRGGHGLEAVAERVGNHNRLRRLHLRLLLRVAAALGTALLAARVAALLLLLLLLLLLFLFSSHLNESFCF